MNSRSVCIKAGLTLVVAAGGVAPVLASGTDQMRVPAIGAPATDSELYFGKKFNFSPDPAFENRFRGPDLNFAPDRDIIEAQPAK